MKTIFRYILFLALYSCCNTVSAYTSFIVGNNAGVDNYRGPSTAAQMTFNYTSTASNLVFYKPTQLGPTGVKCTGHTRIQVPVVVFFTAIHLAERISVQ